MIVELIQAMLESGPLALNSAGRQRLESLIPTFKKVAQGNESEAALLAGIAWTESDFITTAQNSESNAAGLMQIMPAHWPTFGLSGDKWQNAEANIRAGRAILVQSGLGNDPIRIVLARYGGFKKADPNPYVNKVTIRATYLLPRFYFGL